MNYFAYIYIYYSLLKSTTVHFMVQHSLKCRQFRLTNGLTHFDAPLARVMCVFVSMHTGVTLVLITEHKQAVQHSGCAERSLRSRSNREDTLHGLLSSPESGQRFVIHSLDQPSTVHTAPHATS